MTEIVHNLNAKKCGCDACQARRAGRTAADRAAAVGAAHPADCRCRPCTSRRRKLAPAALVGTPAIANQPSALSLAGSSPTAGEDGAGQGDSVVTEQALLDMINKGVNDTLIVEDAVKDKPRSPVPVYRE